MSVHIQREEAMLKYQNDQTFRALESEAKQTQRSDQNQESQVKRLKFSFFKNAHFIS